MTMAADRGNVIIFILFRLKLPVKRFSVHLVNGYLSYVGNNVLQELLSVISVQVNICMVAQT